MVESRIYDEGKANRISSQNVWSPGERKEPVMLSLDSPESRVGVGILSGDCDSRERKGK